MEDIKKKRLEKLVKILENIRGRHTELVTIYVPSGYNLNKVGDQIKTEQSTAQNIKSKTVRKNVLSALERINQHLKLYKKTPDNGLAIFCGNVSEKEGDANIEIWAIEPPEKVKVRLYRCDQNFILDPLKEMIREKEIYGLIVVDKSESEIGLVSGKRVESLKHLESIVPGKTKAGGWSQARYQRIRENLLNDFLKKIGDVANTKFGELKDLKGIVIGGPGGVKDQFREGGFLNHMLKKKVIGTVDTSYSGEPGLKEIVERSEDILSEASVIREKKLLDRFFGELAKDGLAVYGFEQTEDMLKQGNLEVLLISEDFYLAEIKYKCSNCNNEGILRTWNKDDLKELSKCENCSAKNIVEEKDLIDDLIKTAETMGTEVELISTTSPMGGQLKELGGIGGIMRFKA